MKKKTPVHYVDNKRFYEEIVEHKKRVAEARAAGKEDPRLPNYIGECIYKMATSLSTKPCFINYSYREEMIGDGIENCLTYFNVYDPEVGQNPFAYFTTIIYYAFLRRIGKEEKNRYVIYKNFQHTIIHGSNNGSVDTGFSLYEDEAETFTPKMYDNINSFMERFERKEAVKKEKRRKVKEGLIKFYEEETNEQRDPIPD